MTKLLIAITKLLIAITNFRMVANRSTFCGHLAVYIINIGYLLKTTIFGALVTVCGDE